MAQPTLFLIGPGRHFGVELAARFAREGFTVGLITQHAETIALFGSDVHYQLADIADADALTHAIQELAAEIGAPSCLIYNARSPVSGDALSLTADRFNAAMAVNVTGALVAVQAALPLMQTVERPTIILTGGGYKDRPHPQKLALSAGKAALHNLALALEEPLREHGIRLKTIVIDGYVRRDDPAALSANSLADLYWDVHASRPGCVHYFPERPAV